MVHRHTVGVKMVEVASCVAWVAAHLRLGLITDLYP